MTGRRAISASLSPALTSSKKRSTPPSALTKGGRDACDPEPVELS